MKTRLCSVCKRETRPWERICPRCPVASPEQWILVGCTPLRARLSRLIISVAATVGIVVVVRAIAFAFDDAASPRWGSWVHTASVLVVVVVFSVGFIYVSTVFMGFQDKECFEVSATEATAEFWRKNELPIRKGTLALVNLASMRIDQGLVGRLLNYGDIILHKKPDNSPFRRLGDVVAPAAFKERLHELAIAATAFPTPPERVRETKAAATTKKESFGDYVKGVAGIILLLMMLVAMIYGCWTGSEARNLTMRPGQSREIELKGQGLIASPREGLDCSWTARDQSQLHFDIDSPDYVRAEIEESNIVPSKMGSGCLFGLETMLRISILDSAPDGDTLVTIHFKHPKLTPPRVNIPGKEVIKIKIRRE